MFVEPRNRRRGREVRADRKRRRRRRGRVEGNEGNVDALPEFQGNGLAKRDLGDDDARVGRAAGVFRADAVRDDVGGDLLDRSFPTPARESLGGDHAIPSEDDLPHVVLIHLGFDPHAGEVDQLDDRTPTVSVSPLWAERVTTVPSIGATIRVLSRIAAAWAIAARAQACPRLHHGEESEFPSRGPPRARRLAG